MQRSEHDKQIAEESPNRPATFSYKMRDIGTGSANNQAKSKKAKSPRILPFRFRAKSLSFHGEEEAEPEY